jgi:hypothetical protein
MYEKVAQGEKFRISFLLTKRFKMRISYEKFIEVHCNARIDGSRTSFIEIVENRIITRNRLKRSNNELRVIIVESEKSIITILELAKVLKKEVPSIFNPKFIADMNRTDEHRKMWIHIYASATSILGSDEVKEMGVEEILGVDEEESVTEHSIIDDNFDLFSE